MPSGRSAPSSTTAAARYGQIGMRQTRLRLRKASAMASTIWGGRDRLGPCQGEHLSDGPRAAAGNPQALDQIIDVDRLMPIVAATDHHERALVDGREELQQPAGARPVNLRDPNHGRGHS